MTFDLARVARNRLAEARVDSALTLDAILEALSDFPPPGAGTLASEREMAHLRGAVQRGLSQLLYVEHRRNLADAQRGGEQPDRCRRLAEVQGMLIDLLNTVTHGGGQPPPPEQDSGEADG
ncbi:MAG: hypothetical protein IT430_12585 [Phycisphaerales bacterium]|nr:hypothetical protein [Phycisphaerales bacterium]